MSWTVSEIEKLRMEFVVVACEKEVSVSEACNVFGISRKTGYKWIKRYKEEGLTGLTDRSRRPKTSSMKTSGEIVIEIIKLRGEHPYWGPKKLRAIMTRKGMKREEAPSEATIMRILKQAGLSVTKGRGRPRKWKPESELKEGSKPNEVWTVDFKGWWRTKDGSRCEPLTIRDLHSRYILCLKPMKRRKTEEVKAVFEEVFERYGLPDRIRSDNGAPFASMTGIMGMTRLSAWWRTLGIEPDRTQPGHPEGNGAHERMHLDIAKEIEGQPGRTIEDETERLERWRIDYNNVRPHEAIGMKTPREKYRCSKRRVSDIVEYEYPEGFATRKVRCTGCLRIGKRDIYVSEALRGMKVGLEQVDMCTERVWFCNLMLGALVDGRFVRVSQESSIKKQMI